MTLDPGPDVDREICRICGQVISRSRRFFRDDPPEKGWVHCECLFDEAMRLNAAPQEKDHT